MIGEPRYWMPPFNVLSKRDSFDKSGLSAGAVYIYFKSKNEIIRELSKTGKGQFKRVIDKVDDDGKRLQGVLKQLAFLIDNKGGSKGIRVDVSTLAASINDNELQHLVKENVHHNISLINQMIKGEKSLKHLDIKPEILSRIVIALIQGLSIQKMVEPTLSLEEIIKECKL